MSIKYVSFKQYITETVGGGEPEVFVKSLVTNYWTTPHK